MTFIHLHVRSEYAIVDSIVQIKPLIELVKKQRMPACALTDICNLFGMIKFYKAALAQGIQPIIGSELWIQNQNNMPPFKMVLLCQNNIGYLNLVKLISKAYQEGERVEVPLVQAEWIRAHNAGLIALNCGTQGDIGQYLLRDNDEQAAKTLSDWMKIFDNRFYLEVSRTQKENELRYERKLLKLLETIRCPLVASNEVVFLNKADYEAHEAKVCIQEGTTLAQAKHPQYTKEQYLKTPAEMSLLFQDLPSALTNTVEIAKRCAFSFTLDKSYLPSFPVPAEQSIESYLEQVANLGLKERLQFKFEINPVSDAQRLDYEKTYQERLDRELITINKMGFPGYFLIVADFIKWAKQNEIPVGPGRGSGAGSLVAYSLEITDLDPIEYDLLFERFLNPERVSMPDFDIDFCMDNRDRVIEYVMERYGRSNVSQIATFGTMAAKAVIRDVGRVLNHPYGFVDKIAKLIPFEIGMTIDKALEQEQVLRKRYEEEEEVKALINLAKKLEGITRNIGKHAGGVVIAPSELTNFAPLYLEQNNANIVIQLDKDDVESIGLTKFDFLGLRTLTIIDKALRIANDKLRKLNQPVINIARIPLDCSKTFDLLKSCSTTAVFQLESRGMKELIKRLQPDHLEEIIALVALFRPGPLQSGMVDDFINRKHGRQKMDYFHPRLEPILKSTYGVILYQEQVMQIAQTLAGYTLGSADLLRRAMGKKKPEEMAKQRHIFVEGAIAQGVDQNKASTIFDIIEKFAGYGFNKSHSAAYALVSYQTAWLKTHFPSAFMAAVLSSDMNHTDKVVNMIEECKNISIPVLPPDINQSLFEFTVNDNGEIRYGLGAIKGLGEAAINAILEQRNKKPFQDFFDFCDRMDSRKVNKKIYECLIKSGSLDTLGLERSEMMAHLPMIMQAADQRGQSLSRGQQDLFGVFNPQTQIQHNIQPWDMQTRLIAEKEALGLYFSGHPLNAVASELKRMGIRYFKDIPIPKKESKVLIAGTILSIKTIQTKNGDRMGIVMLDDSQSRFEVTLFSEVYQNNREMLNKDAIIIGEATCLYDANQGQIKLRVQKLYSLASYQSTHAKRLILKLFSEHKDLNFIEKIKDVLILNERGTCSVYLEYYHQDALVKLKFNNKWDVKVDENTLSQLKKATESLDVELEY